MGLLGRVKQLFSRRKDEPIHSFALLRAAPRMLDPETVERAVNRALGVEFSKKDENDPEASFVVGFPPAFMVKIPDAMLLVNCFPSPYFNKPEKAAAKIPELRIRKAVEEHQAWISVDWMGDKDEESLRKAYPMIGKIAAELIDDECLAVFSTSTGQMVPVDEELVELMRGDDPLDAFNQMILPPVVSISDDDPRMKAATEEAKRRWPEFVSAYNAKTGESFSVKAPVSDGRNTEFIWIEVAEIDGENIAGDLANDPVDLQFMKLGSRVRTTTDKMNDWAYIRDGELIGGFTVKVLQETVSG